MPRCSQLRAALAFALVAPGASPAPVAAQDAASPEAAPEAPEVPSDRGTKKPQIVFAPVPFSSPSSGTGVAAGA